MNYTTATIRARELAETITTVDGETIEGTHGLISPAGDFVDMDGIVGDAARAVLDANAREFHVTPADPEGSGDFEGDVDAVAEWIAETVGVPDHIDDRGGEAVVYRADVPRVDDDEPYTCAVSVDGPEWLVGLILGAYERLCAPRVAR